MKKSTTYTAEDFATAEFARHPDGRIAARVDSGNLGWWAGGNGRAEPLWMDDYDMAEEGFVPVREAYENDGRVKRLKRHISDVEAVVKRRGQDIERLEAEKAELRERIKQCKAGPITLDALHEAWEGAEVADECNEGDILILRSPDSPTALVQVWRSARPGPMSIYTRILHRAPKREPWQDLADVLRADNGELIGEHHTITEVAKALHERGVRVTGGGDG